MSRAAHRRPLARFIRVLNPDGTIKRSYELNERARLIHPIGVTVLPLPRNDPRPADYASMGYVTDQSPDALSRAEFMAALEPSIPFRDMEFDSSWALQYLSSAEASPIGFEDWGFN
jgi:hypothetical protein